MNNSYVFSRAKVSVVFYDRTIDWRGKVIRFFNLTRLHHCGIIFSMKNESILLMSDKTHRAKFIDADRFHETFFKPYKTIDLGFSDVSITQITNYIKTPYIGDARSIVFWYFISRGLLRIKHLQPKTCALLVSNILRLCGFQVEDCVTPRKLYRELQNYAVDSNCRTSGSR